MSREPGAAIPSGWQLNPSKWSQRLPIVVVAMVGFGIAGYLALYQYDVVPTVWEPFFGDGSEVILNSPLSHVLPVSDAALGAGGYLLDAVTGIAFGVQRWRTQPWIVVIFAIAIGPLGLVSILLVIAQPVLYSAFCTLCLATAVISIVMIPPAVDEVLASLQHLKRVQLKGESVWLAFWGLGPNARRVEPVDEREKEPV